MKDGHSMSYSGAGRTEGPMSTSGGKAPGVKRISKHPVKSLTSRKSQQKNGAC